MVLAYSCSNYLVNSWVALKLYPISTRRRIEDILKDALLFKLFAGITLNSVVQPVFRILLIQLKCNLVSQREAFCRVNGAVILWKLALLIQPVGEDEEGLGEGLKYLYYYYLIHVKEKIKII